MTIKDTLTSNLAKAKNIFNSFVDSSIKTAKATNSFWQKGPPQVQATKAALTGVGKSLQSGGTWLQNLVEKSTQNKLSEINTPMYQASKSYMPKGFGILNPIKTEQEVKVGGSVAKGLVDLGVKTYGRALERIGTKGVGAFDPRKPWDTLENIGAVADIASLGGASLAIGSIKAAGKTRNIRKLYEAAKVAGQGEEFLAAIVRRGIGIIDNNTGAVSILEAGAERSLGRIPFKKARDLKAAGLLEPNAGLIREEYRAANQGGFISIDEIKDKSKKAVAKGLNALQKLGAAAEDNINKINSRASKEASYLDEFGVLREDRMKAIKISEQLLKKNIDDKVKASKELYESLQPTYHVGDTVSVQMYTPAGTYEISKMNPDGTWVSRPNIEEIGKPMKLKIVGAEFDLSQSADNISRTGFPRTFRLNNLVGVDKDGMRRAIYSSDLVNGKHLKDTINIDPRDLLKEYISMMKKSKASGPVGFSSEPKLIGKETVPYPKVLEAPSAKKGMESAKIPEKYIDNINTERMALKGKAATVLKETAEKIKPELEAIMGKSMTNEDIIKEAQKSKIVRRIIPPEQVKNMAASTLRTRQYLTELSNKVDTLKSAGLEGTEEFAKLTQELIESFKVNRSLSYKEGFLLQARRIMADGADTMRPDLVDEIIKKLDPTDAKIDEIIKESTKVNFNNMSEVTSFYRKWIKPSTREIIDEIRYINMLSNPRTQTTNIFTNLTQAAIQPVDKIVTGALDTVQSALTGKEREFYIKEAPEYTRAALNSIPDAWKEAKNVFRMGIVERPDIKFIPTNKIPLVPQKLQKAARTPLRLLEAADVFFRRIIADGEYASLVLRNMKKSKGAELSEEALRALRKEADDLGQAAVFRKKLGDSSQGGFFRGLDALGNGIKKVGEGVPAVRWFVPYIDTPLNILKEGIERTPGIGLAALPGAKNKTQILAKQVVGSVITASVAHLALQGRITWKAPRGEKQREQFFAEGKQPYAVKIGDHWVQYSKLGPLSYPIALVAASKAAFDEDAKGERSKVENMGRAMLKLSQFFGDQSYVESVGNVLDALFEDDWNAFERLAANPVQQLTPYYGFLGFVARMIDDVYRNPDNIVENWESQIPWLSKTLKPYTDPSGQPAKRQYNPFMQISPINITKEQQVRPRSSSSGFRSTSSGKTNNKKGTGFGTPSYKFK